MLTITGITKTYGDRTLFRDVDLTVGTREKIGLVGRNGTGKSTFLRILLGLETIEGGTIRKPKGYRIRSLEQHMNFSEKSILAQVCSAMPVNSDSEDWKAKSILMGLGFKTEDFDRHPSEFSSGFQVRIRLAEALVAESDLLLLDEPTNYLDILSLRWLERFLKNWKGSFILVTHDQSFMKLVVTHSVAIHRGRMRKMKGDPLKLMEHIKKDEEIYEKTRVNREKKKKKDEEFIRKFRAGARSAGLVQSRIKALEKLEIKDKLDHIANIKFNFHSLPCKSNSILRAEGVSFSYTPEQRLIQNLSLTTLPGDRVAIIGRNGKGKSTLLRILHQTLEPDAGTVTTPPSLAVSYFGIDSIKELSPQRSIFEELIAMPDTTEQEVRNLCGSLLFRGDAIKKGIKMLSGGEKSRVCLGKTLLYPSQLLMLDEPTNHLDMESVEALTDALENYKGTVIFVTHNEAMLSRLATKLVLFERDSIRVLNYGYDRFLEEGGWSEEQDSDFKAYRPDSDKKKKYINDKEQRKEQRQLKKNVEKLEKDIEKLEEKKQDIGALLQKACADKDVDKIKELGITAKECDDQIEMKYSEMEEVMEKII